MKKIKEIKILKEQRDKKDTRLTIAHIRILVYPNTPSKYVPIVKGKSIYLAIPIAPMTLIVTMD